MATQNANNKKNRATEITTNQDIYGGMGRKWRMPGGGQTSAKKACSVEIRPFLNHPKHKLKATKAFKRLRSRFVEPTQQEAILQSNT
mmetsp:Transcript_27040/g.47083  ORF Transcript_27040/g.47083 Transcript_27040/m.47083 type:complete len:87 (+) Transcript_27040:169-429(+)